MASLEKKIEKLEQRKIAAENKWLDGDGIKIGIMRRLNGSRRNFSNTGSRCSSCKKPKTTPNSPFHHFEPGFGRSMLNSKAGCPDIFSAAGFFLKGDMQDVQDRLHQSESRRGQNHSDCSRGIVVKKPAAWQAGKQYLVSFTNWTMIRRNINMVGSNLHRKNIHHFFPV